MSSGGHNFIDESGNTYGKLNVVVRAKKENRPNVYWVCRCECGNEVVVSGSNLRLNKKESCGCDSLPNAVNDIRGQKFAKLIAQEYKPGGRWLCKCDCGNETSVYTANLTKGNTKSCGCLQKQIATRIGYESRE